MPLFSRKSSLVLGLAFCIAAFTPFFETDPPFSGTIFIDPDIITSSDPSTFQSIVYAGQGVRTMYDRRVNNWIQNNAFLFNVTFEDGLSTEIQVNSEFGTSTTALPEATTYAIEVGRLPHALRADVQTMWIHKGVQPFGGGNNNILIHTGQAANYVADGILEETLVHEAAHTSLDSYHAASTGWLAAQQNDPTFISTYARDYPNREDIAESFLPYLAIRYRADRISTGLKNTIETSIPVRIQYFDQLSLNMYPIVIGTGRDSDPQKEVPDGVSLDQNYPNPVQNETTISFEVPSPGAVSVRILNLLGQDVIQLVNESKSPGSYSVEWNGRDSIGRLVAVGTYLYVVESAQSLMAKTLVVAR